MPSCWRCLCRALIILLWDEQSWGPLEQRGDGRGFCLTHFALFFFFNVKKLNARFEFLIRPSSSCHLFCFVMHYIQLHISNPQILPRHQHTCQAFTFRRRRIKGLFLSRLLAPRHGMPSGPQQLPYSDPKAAPTPSTRTKPLQRGPGEAPAPMLGAGCSAQHLSGGDSISPISHSA